MVRPTRITAADRGGTGRCCFVPPFLLERLAGAENSHPGRRTLEIDARMRGARGASTAPVAPATGPITTGTAVWTIHTAENGSDLPGPTVRAAGEPAAGDDAVDEAYTGVESSLALFADVYDRASYDGVGAPVIATVHYEQDYDNAFWDGTQLVLGDGDGEVFGRFTRPVDVLAHEFTHAFTERTAALAYEGQSGALNESVSDVFASCVTQRVLGQSAAEGSWLIGEGIFLPGVQGRALRSMSAPGTAYDDPRLGTDPQVGSMDDYVDTDDDSGGVHTNSGIPNRAFYLAATGIGGSSAAGAGRIWYDAMTGGSVTSDTDFAGFAAATIEAAGEHRDVVEQAWSTVGVGTAPRPAPASPPAGASGRVRVRRTGGLAGRAVEGWIDLDSDDPQSVETRELLARVDLRSLAESPPQPDRFVYRVVVGRESAQVAEQDLTGDLARLVDIVLGRDSGADTGNERP